MEAKIETGRHNLKINMDKDLIKLQKEINLHVADIKRIQGLMQRLALQKGETADELRRNKEKSRKTQVFLSQSKKVQSSSMKNAGDTSSPDRTGTMKQTMLSGGPSTTGKNAQGSLIVDLLLFGENAARRKGLNMSTSFNNTITSSSTGAVSQVMPLRYMLKNCPIIKFEISMTNADGSRRTDTQMEEGGPKKGKKNMIKGGKTNA